MSPQRLDPLVYRVPTGTVPSLTVDQRSSLSCESTLTGAWGAMERVNATPLPFAYVAHLRTFLLLYLHLWAVEALAKHA